MKPWRAGLAFGAALIAGSIALPVSSARDEKKLFFLEFSHETPQELILEARETAEPDIFWYMLYTLKNVDAEDHPFFLQITAENNKNVRYRDGYHPMALQRIRQMTGNEARVRLKDGTEVTGLLEKNIGRIDVETESGTRSFREEEVEEVAYLLWGHKDVTTPDEIASVPVGKGTRPLGKPFKIARPVIKAGETRQCAAIFRRLDPETDRLTIRLLGLTNDIKVEEAGPHARKVTERIYEIEYKRPGDEFYPGLDRLFLVREAWMDQVRTIKTDLRSPERE